MNSQNENNKNSEPLASIGRHRLPIAGIVLILIGLLALAPQLVPSDLVGLAFLPGLGLIFLAWGVAARNEALFIPGGILSGIGLGIILIEKVFTGLGDEAQGGVFMLAFALGWVVIPVLGRLVTGKAHWWPFVPAGMIGLLGAALVIGGETLTWVGKSLSYLWPLVLIGIGLYVILRGRRTADEP